MITKKIDSEGFGSGSFARIISSEKLAYALLFLFPCLGMLVNHGLTAIYNMLFLLGLYYLGKHKTAVAKEEKYFLIICATYFVVFVISGILNDWGEMQTRYLGTEIRFLFVIPIYLMVREFPESRKWLLWGSLLATVVVFTQMLFEVYIEKADIVEGVYGKVIFGPFSVLIAFWVLYLWQDASNKLYKIFIIIGFSVAILAAMMSGSRGAYLGVLVLFVTGMIIFIRAWKIIVIGLVLFGALFITYSQSTIVNESINKAVVGFEDYVSSKEAVTSTKVITSVGIRLEMWRAAKYFFPDHPILGVGPGNYQAMARKYANEGKVNPIIAEYSHPHNAYLEALYSKGIIGLVSLLVLLYYPLYIMIKTLRISRLSAALGIMHIIGISAFSMVEAAPILMNKYTSVLLLGMAVFFSYHMQQVRLIKNQSLTGKSANDTP